MLKLLQFQIYERLEPLTGQFPSYLSRQAPFAMFLYMIVLIESGLEYSLFHMVSTIDIRAAGRYLDVSSKHSLSSTAL